MDLVTFLKTHTKIIKGISTGMKGKPSETILLTPKCFKLMAMQSKTKKAIQVREFYYELEQVIDQYKEYIIKGLQDKIKTLENNQKRLNKNLRIFVKPLPQKNRVFLMKPKINPSKGVIYIIQTSDGIGHYKIGKTKNLRKRLNNYNGDKKDDIIPIYIYETEDIKKYIK